MPSLSGMWAAVAQTAALGALTSIYEHVAAEQEIPGVWDNAAFAGFMRVVEERGPSASQKANDPNITVTVTAPNSTVLSVSNGTSSSSAPPHFGGAFYLSELPRSIAIGCLVLVLDYWWQVLLERMLPGRPRRVEAAYQQQQKKEKKREGPGGTEKQHVMVVEGDEDREEEVVKRWIAEGRVQRSSLSWWNTFLKWFLDATVGRAVVMAIGSSLELVFKWKKPLSGILKFWGWDRLLGAVFLNCFTSAPLVALISFAAIPVEKRLQFRAGMWLLISVFVDALLRALIPWAVNTELAQETLVNMTRWVEEESRKQPLHVIDEL